MKNAILLVFLCAVVYASAIGGVNNGEKCLASAGYTWCAFENKCVRPWELAKEKGLEMSVENIDSYCNIKKIGGSQDSNGCIKTAGYSWCAKENQCVRPWELATLKQISIKSEADFQNYCNNSTQNPVGADADSHNCLASAGYSWCKKENKCVKSWELLKTLGLESTPISFQTYCSDCLASAGYSYCYAEQKCVRPWELAKQLAIKATPQSIKSYCAQNPATKVAPKAQIGGESDNHGCVAGEGYSWCQTEGKCVRPWELASLKQIANTPESFEQYCNIAAATNPGTGFITGPLIPSPGAAQNPPDAKTIGGESDNHGCVAGAGYSWCQTEGKCVRPWELAQEKNMKGMTAESFAAYCSPQ